MISTLTGILRHVDDGQIEIDAGPIRVEVLVPASDIDELNARTGEQITFHTIFYLAGDPARGGLEPTLIGFLRRDDKRFFELFTTVKGIGPKKALKALTVPASQVAAAIESNDTRFLSGLSGIGKRSAETIVAELRGKAARFAAHLPGGVAAVGKASAATTYTDDEQDALKAMTSLGERPIDAERLLERAKAQTPPPTDFDALVRTMLRLRNAR